MIDETIDIHSIEFQDSLRDYCLRHLASLPCSTWGRNWGIWSDKERLEAADWLAATMVEVMALASTDNASDLLESP